MRFPRWTRCSECFTWYFWSPMDARPWMKYKVGCQNHFAYPKPTGKFLRNNARQKRKKRATIRPSPR